MNIAVMGTGGVGGYFGSLLAKSGQSVMFIARGAHFEAIHERGIEIKSVFGDFTIKPARVTDNPAKVGPADLVIVATKTYHTDAVAQAIRPMVGDETVVMSLQNGVDAADRIGAFVGMEHMIGATTWLSAAIEEPGVIGQYSQFRRIAFGELNGEKSSRTQRIFDVLNATGAVIELVDNITKVLWTKFVFISAVSALGGLTRLPFGDYRNVPEARAILTSAIQEVAAVARAKGIQLDDDVVEKTLVFIDSSAPVIKPSFQRDLEAGRVSELESMIGIVVQLSSDLGIAAPVMNLAYGAIKPSQIKALGK
ncbi:MAG: 2-dehydropantoate 2-reductase [Deltaproteobacteria bacterium]|nr:2-dehydropantoate 2-reductase [Deltaproteobacteria bacterium]